jgi:hypothetical protein
MNISPAINNNPNVALPAQMVSLAKKNAQWVKDNMDSLERIGTIQYYYNMSLIENYQMVKGKFIFSHYLEQDEYADMVHQLSREFEIPNYLRHYDIISQVINTLSGEYQKRPDNFRVKGYDENTTNNYIREKTRLLLQYVMQDINNEVNLRLSEMGLNPNKSDFKSQQEQQQYQQQVDQQRQALTPPEVEKYMKYTWQDTAEIWGQYQLEVDKQRFLLMEKERVEFEDMLIADRCFRHFYLTSNGYNQETWNPVNTFFHKSPEVDWVEDGDYVGRIIYLTVNDCIDRYGYMMKKGTIKDLELTKDLMGKMYGKDGQGIAYGAVVPYQNYGDGKLMRDAFGVNPAAPYIPTFTGDFLSTEISTHNPYFLNTRGYLKVLEAYWKSQKKIGKVTYLDPETNQVAKMLVDETFVVPEGFKEVDSAIYENDDGINTVSWTWVNEVWRGIKICKHGTQLKDDIYLNASPLPFQFKGDINPYYAKLPVCGAIFNNRNSQSMSLVDLMKPWQIGFNVSANQLYQTMQREIGRFLIMDVNMLTNIKDWGGENSYEKFLLVAKSLGLTFVDTSPQNMKGANPGGQMPKMIDMDESARMMSRMKIMEFFEQKALSQVGITPQRLGSVAASETATGTQQAIQQSYAQTESYFTRFSEYKKRTLRMNLNIAQYVQSKEKDVTIMYTKSDMSRAFLKMNGTELMLSDLQVYVSDSQEDMRQLEALRQLFLTNNNTGASPVDLAAVITSNSPSEIKAQLEVAMARNEQKYQQQQDLEQQQIQAQKDQQQAQLDFDANQKELDRENKKEVAYIQTFARQPDNLKDENLDNIPDVFEYDKMAMEAEVGQQKLDIEREKVTVAREKTLADTGAKLADLKVRQQELVARQKVEAEKVKVAKINKNKYDGKKS